MKKQINPPYAHKYMPKRSHEEDGACDIGSKDETRSKPTHSTLNSSNSTLNTHGVTTDGTNDDTNTCSEDEDEEYVWKIHKTKSTQGGPASFMAAALATTAAVKVAGGLLDEDVLLTTVGAMVNALGSGGGGGGGAVAGGGAGVASMPAAQAAALQQMAVGAAQSATGSVASGTAAAGSAGAGGGAGGNIGAASSNSAASGGAAAATVVTAVAAGIYATGLNGQPLVCPNITNPDIFPGSVSFDFWGLQERPNETQSLVLATSFIERYDDIFGCDSVFARSMINCSLPCTEESAGNFTSTTRCCESFDDAVFGGVVKCTFNCFVHCVGCPFEEPLFLEPRSFWPTPAPYSMDPLSGQRMLEENEECSPLCLIGQELESQICTEATDDCRVVRGTVHTNNMLASANETSNSNVEVYSDELGIYRRETFVPAPSLAPTSHPTSFYLGATFFDEFGFSYGSVDGAVLSASNVGRSLTIRVDVPFNVRAVAFFFDEERVFEDHHRPFFIFSENEDGFGTTYPPLLNVGFHTVTFVAYAEDLREIEVHTVYFRMIE